MRIVLLSFFLLALGCKSEKKSTPFFDELPGKWMRTNEEKGKATYEYWQKDSIDYYSGKAFTLVDTDTVFLENLRIIQIENQWNLEVAAPQEKPVLFAIKSQTASGFTAQNNANEYPKKVEYLLENEELTAKISGGGPEIIFDFEKIKP